MPVDRVVDKKRIIGKNGRAEEEERHKVSLTPKETIIQNHCLRPDREVINRIGAGLTSHKPELIRDACEELTADILEEFPVEIFIQRPDLIFALQDVLLLNVSQAQT
jgi:hypothetical protein